LGHNGFVSLPTYDELAADNHDLRVMVQQLQARIIELEARLTSNSTNSSRPPSSDGLAKPAPRSLRRRTGKKPGGQQGHPGSTLMSVAVPDEVIRHEPHACRGCGGDLADAEEIDITRRQVFDLPPIQICVTEHQLITRRCGCGVTTRADAPVGVTTPVQYGPRITTRIPRRTNS